MEKYERKVQIKCYACGKESKTVMEFGENPKYPDDFVMECPKCGNNEEGSLPVQNFDILKEY